MNAKKERADGNDIKANELKSEAENLRKKEEELKLAIEYQEVKMHSEKDHIIVQPDEPKTATIPKIAGVIRRRKWNYDIIDIDKVPETFVIVEKMLTINY